MNSIDMTEDELHAYVDGRLDAGRAVQVRAYLAAHPEQHQRLQAYAEQKQQLRQLFDPVLGEAVPPRLAALLQEPPPQQETGVASAGQHWQWGRIAAMLLLALGSGAAGWGLHATLVAPELALRAAPPAYAGLAQRAAIAHVVYSPDQRRPVEIAAEQQDQLVKWLSKRLGSDIRPAHLSELGYELIGGRLLPGNSGPVAQFMYQDGGGQRLTLYVSAEQVHNQDSGFRFATENGVNVFYWIDGPFGYALSGAVDKGRLAHIATAVYQQLAPAR